MKIIRTLLFISLLILGSCASFKKLEHTDNTPISKENMALLNGYYSNAPSDSMIKEKGFNKYDYSLWVQLDGRLRYKRDCEKYMIHIVVENENLIKATLLYENTAIQEIKIHGRIKNGYFYKRRFFLIIPFFPLLFFYDNSQIRLGVLNNSLLVDNSANFWNFALLAGNEGNIKRTAAYKKQ